MDISLFDSLNDSRSVQICVEGELSDASPAMEFRVEGVDNARLDVSRETWRAPDMFHVKQKSLRCHRATLECRVEY